MLTEEGLPAVPTTSNDDLLDIGEIDVIAADETNDEEESNLSEPDHEPSQRSPKTLKRRKTRRRTDAEPPLTKNTNHTTRKEIRAENAATVKHGRKKEQ